MELSQNILKYREQLGLSQEQLAEKLNISPQAIALWETGQEQPTIDTLKILANTFGVSIDQLYGNTQIEETNQPLFTASIKYSDDILITTSKVFMKKNIVICWIGIALSIIITIGLLLSDVDNALIFLPFFFGILFGSSIMRINRTIKTSAETARRDTPNLQAKYWFYNDHFVLNVWSDNSTATFNKKYSELKAKLHDDKYIYIMFDNRYAVIDKESCNEHLDQLSQLIGLQQKQTNTGTYKYTNSTDSTNEQKPQSRWVSALLIVLFLLSLASLFIALMLMAMARVLSPLPEFALATTEHMWVFYLVIPIPATSIALGIIYKRKGYKCKKNIVAGIIMAVILFIYGSFTAIFDPQISHDMQYVEELSQEIGFEIPTDGYVSVTYDSSNESESFAMVKITDMQEPNFVARLQNSYYWKGDISFIPANVLGAYELASTRNYDYFAVYNTTTDSYNNFTGKLIYLAYDVETNILYVYCYK